MRLDLIGIPNNACKDTGQENWMLITVCYRFKRAKANSDVSKYISNKEKKLRMRIREREMCCIMLDIWLVLVEWCQVL